MGDVQPSRSSSRAGSSGGILVGAGSGDRAFERKAEQLLRDKSSASIFSLPGTCVATTSKPNHASKMITQRMRCIIALSRHVRLVTAQTAAALSQRQSTLAPLHRMPQIAMATRSAKSSFQEICSSLAATGHWNWNQDEPDQAPHPQLPDPSEVTEKAGFAVGGNAATPFQCVENVHHQWRSARNSRFSRIWCCPFVAPGVPKRSMALRRNVLPGLTTRQACCSVPTRDSSCRRRHTLRCNHWARRPLRRHSLSWGRRSTPSIVSSSMPRNVRRCDGPSSFANARRTPRSAQTDSILSRFCWHSAESGGPSVIKSSR